MLKIEIDDSKEMVVRKGDSTQVMAEMLSATHIFYTKLNESDKKTFRDAFEDNMDVIFSDDGEQKQGHKSADNIDVLIYALDSIKSILKELAE